MLLLLLACAGAPPAPPEDSDAPESVTPWEYEAESQGPSLSASEVEALAASRVGLLLSIDPFPLYEAYNLAMSGQTRDCPGTWEIAGVYGWGTTCTAETGWRYDGRSQGLYGPNIVFDGEPYLQFGSLLSNAEIQSPDGEVLSLVGYGDLWERALEDESVNLYAYFLGEFSWTGLPEPDHWLRQDLSLALISESQRAPDGARWWRLDGGVNPLTDPDNITLSARDLLASSESACQAEPGGALVLNVGEGERYVLRFHGGPDADMSACDGCAELLFEDSPLGEACVDLSAMFDWEERPW
ncbi:MAG: hypothetical protein H6741_21595 [Alphaproteobacteria bacterium]|nr:hypothetical protein [Alphaproteobacteria bacterium]MCB9795306.1 hypothetical protein [Alphaproteobacteria bacterium]